MRLLPCHTDTLALTVLSCRGFLPSIGPLITYKEPLTVDGASDIGTVRIDTGVFEGATISMYYDPMISKLCTHAPTRDQAIRVMEGALDQYVVQGLGNNITFLRDVYRNPRCVLRRCAVLAVLSHAAAHGVTTVQHYYLSVHVIREALNSDTSILHMVSPSCIPRFAYTVIALQVPVGRLQHQVHPHGVPPGLPRREADHARDARVHRAGGGHPQRPQRAPDRAAHARHARRGPAEVRAGAAPGAPETPPGGQRRRAFFRRPG
jgi:hypothetical protein